MTRYRALSLVKGVSRSTHAQLTSPKFGYKRYSTNVSTGTPTPTKDSLHEALQNLKTVFPNRNELYSRIDLVTSSSPVPKIGVIPFKSARDDIKSLTESLLADPLASNQDWFQAFRNRLLSKDVLIKWAPAFEYVGNNNSLIEYPVPFRTADDSTRQNTQILEVNSVSDSMEHLKDCHLHIFVTTSVKDVLAMSPLPKTDYPSILVVDDARAVRLDQDQEPAGAAISQTKFPSTVWVSSKIALEAVDKLIESPSNSSIYLTKWKESRIATVEDIVFSSLPVLNGHLVDSVIATCQSIVEPSLKSHAEQQAEKGISETVQMREQWAQQAHRELQGTLSQSLETMQSSILAWWKLYYKVDDIYDTALTVIYRQFLPISKERLEYCLGRIDQQAIEIYGTAPSTSPPTEIFDAQNALAATEAVTLHDTGLKLLTTTIFGIQLPLTIIPLLGVYFYDYSMYAMASIIGLGVVVGFRYLQKGWLKATDQFNLAVKEKARLVLASSERLIWSSYESKVLEQQKLASHRQQLIENVRRAKGNYN
ncbi:hypothetical protein AWJ20_4084 [Sugiyamaella lignohabitans]|uniref:Mmc1 C-terminal domain-containing protein n=1 Tax=Sugiyamaella lignohabitans TaxID=796027 RepID=A0A167C6I4_9ASCO|nr:uncharacterized protein AWJ20_4084 [Sugiyamaella lignohabitans]ANB11280.1 hypothetical protein AWJ20_4084 [Sugiyamaella lignohabitans]